MGGEGGAEGHAGGTLAGVLRDFGRMAWPRGRPWGIRDELHVGDKVTREGGGESRLVEKRWIIRGLPRGGLSGTRERIIKETLEAAGFMCIRRVCRRDFRN